MSGNDDDNGVIRPFRSRVELPDFDDDPGGDGPEETSSFAPAAPEGGPNDMAPPLHMVLDGIPDLDGEDTSEGAFVGPAPEDPASPGAKDALGTAMSFMTAFGVAASQGMWHRSRQRKAHADKRRADADKAKAAAQGTKKTTGGSTASRTTKSSGGSGGGLLGGRRSSSGSGSRGGSGGSRGSGGSKLGRGGLGTSGRGSSGGSRSGTGRGGSTTGGRRGAAGGSKGPAGSGSGRRGSSSGGTRGGTSGGRSGTKSSKPPTSGAKGISTPGTKGARGPKGASGAGTRGGTSGSAKPGGKTAGAKGTGPAGATKPNGPAGGAAPGPGNARRGRNRWQRARWGSRSQTGDFWNPRAGYAQGFRDQDAGRWAYGDHEWARYGSEGTYGRSGAPPGPEGMRPPPAARPYETRAEQIFPDPKPMASAARNALSAGTATASPDADPKGEPETVTTSTHQPGTQYSDDTELTIHDVCEADADMAVQIAAGVTEAQSTVDGCDLLYRRLESLRAQVVELRVPGSLEGMLLTLMDQTSSVRSSAVAIAEGLPAAAEAIATAGSNAEARHRPLADAVADAGHTRPAERDYHNE